MVGSFKIYWINNNFPILLSTIDNSITYDEKLQINKNDQFQLTFSIVQNNKTNTFVKYLKNGAKLLLVLDELEKIELIITNVKPTINPQSSVYNYTAKDLISVNWPKRNIGYSLNTEDMGGVQYVVDIGKRILLDNNLSGQWTIKVDESNQSFRKKISFAVENSNPYNALIELANSINAIIKVNYTNHTISLLQQDKSKFSGYRYRLQNNLKSFSADYKCDKMCNILHVTGGTDEYDQIVTLVPTIPYAVEQYFIQHKAEFLKNMENESKIIEFYEQVWNNIKNQEQYQSYTEIQKNEIDDFFNIAIKHLHLSQFLINFSYLLNSSLLNEIKYNKLLLLFYNDMRIINWQLKIASKYYYQFNYELVEWSIFW